MLKKIATTWALVALLVAAFAVAAYAATAAVGGTPFDDDLYEEHATEAENIFGYAGSDDIFANVGEPTAVDDADYVYGHRGDDFLTVRDRDTLDVVYGGRGYDIAVVDRNLDTGKQDQVGGGVELVRVRGFDPTP